MARPELDAAAERALRMRAKQELRRRMRSVRQVMPVASCEARSAAICAAIGKLPAFERAHTVVGFVAFRKEPDPHAALLRAEELGKRVGLVRVQEGGALTLHRYRSGDALVENEYGIPEPPEEAEPIEPGEVSLVLVPALAVDARGHRIGYGQGYYDRLLPRMPQAFKLAIAYDFQLLAELPNTESDVAVDCVVTDARTLFCEPGAAP